MCKGELIVINIEKEKDEIIETGTLKCLNCEKLYDIKCYIPRFVPLENYASGFGLEWTKHAKTQYDSYTGTNISEKRFFEETKWPRKLDKQVVLEVGSGSGRFTEQAASTGAMIVSMDYSYAVEVNYLSNGRKENVLIVQADIYNMPFKKNYFDKLFCFGVLQHTPDVKKAFMILPGYLKRGGSLAIDVYLKPTGIYRLLNTRYKIRPITKRIEPQKLYEWCKRYIEVMWPLSKIFRRIPVIGRQLNWMLLIADYAGVYKLSDNLLKEWAILDTFDMLSPMYDFPQSIETVMEWFKSAELINIEVKLGYNGIEGRGTRRINA